jgi:hypothetical protein
MRLRDIGPLLGITSRAVGKVLDLMGFRCNKRVTDLAFAAGCGVRRWDGDRFHIDWHRDRVVEAIRAPAQSRGDTLVEDALAVAVAKEDAAARAATRKREQQDIEAARQREEEAVILGLESELRALLATDPEIGMLNAVEYITADPALRVVLCRPVPRIRSPLAWVKTTIVAQTRTRRPAGISPLLERSRQGRSGIPNVLRPL